MQINLPEIRFGVAGWSYPDWEGYVYEKRQKNKLRFIAAFVDIIEINNTFYRMPEKENVLNWFNQIKDIPHKFFSLKLHQLFTHHKEYSKDDVNKFKENVMPLMEANRLSHILAQFPQYFNFTEKNKHTIQEIEKHFSFHDIQLVFELRHKSWRTIEAFSFLTSHNISISAIDSPIDEDYSFIPHPQLTGKNAYFRLHGRNKTAWEDEDAGRNETYNYLYNSTEIKNLAENIRKLAQNAKSVTVIGNNHFRGKELVNVLELKTELTNKKAKAPHLLLSKYPHLKQICEEEIEQQNLI